MAPDCIHVVYRYYRRYGTAPAKMKLASLPKWPGDALTLPVDHTSGEVLKEEYTKVAAIATTNHAG